MYGPVIHGKLVRLRPPKPDEVAEFAAWFEDLEVTRFLKLRNPPSFQAEKEFLERTAQDPNVIWWAVEHEGWLVGATGIHRIDWKHGFGTTGTLIGDKKAWGKGLARELMQLRAEYAFMQTPLRTLRSGYLDGNVASARAQKAAGYKEVGRWHDDHFIDGKWTDQVLTELRREDWAKGRSV
jgi:ribosomal-protein-alanine N-acetyltransferase